MATTYTMTYTHAVNSTIIIIIAPHRTGAR